MAAKNPDITEVLARNINHYADAMDLSIAEIARRAGFHRNTVMRMARAEGGFELPTIRGIAAALGVNEIDLFRASEPAKLTIVPSSPSKRMTTMEALEILMPQLKLNLPADVIEGLGKITSKRQIEMLRSFLDEVVRD